MRFAVRLTGALFLLAAFLPTASAQTGKESPTAADEKLLQAHKIGTDADSLLKFVQQHTLTGGEEQEIGQLIHQLGNSKFRVREKAEVQLLAYGPKALARLQEALSKADLETHLRLEKCIASIKSKADPKVHAAAVRLLGVRQPAGTCKALLDYLPNALEEAVQTAVLEGLAKAGTGDGKMDAVLVAGLKSQQTERRAAAALLVGRFGAEKDRKKVRKLLTDPLPAVRFHAAQGLLVGRDTSGLPALLALLGEGPYDLAEKTEDLFQSLAGEAGPKVQLNDEKTARQECRAAWQKWWQAPSKKLAWEEAEATLPWSNQGGSARRVSQQFIEAIQTGNLSLLEKTTTIPFYIGVSKSGIALTMASRQEFNTLLGQAAQHAKENVMKITILAVQPGSQYFAKAGGKGQQFLQKVGATGLYVVTIEVHNKMAPRRESGGILVRRQGGQARVIGILGGE